MMNQSEIQSRLEQLFPSMQQMLYVNHAAISPWPLSASEAVTRYSDELAQRGPLAVSRWALDEAKLRRRIAAFLSAESADDIALLRNTTEGISLVANGIDWQPGDNLVTPEGEFITNQMPWDSLKARGVDIRRVDIRKASQAESALINAMDERTRVLSVSAVQWDDGFRLDLERLGALCATGDAIFFVDAIQQLGALSIDVQRCRIDALSAGAHKWMTGPEGMAVFFTTNTLRQRLNLTQFGWRMRDNPFDFDDSNRSPSQSSRRFETGSPSSLGQAALLASAEMFAAVGLSQVEKRVLANTDQLIKGLDSISGVRIVSRTEAERRSGIVSFRHQSTDANSIRRQLSKQAVFVAVRNGNVRLSPHFYQQDKHMSSLLNAIEASL